MKPKIEEEYISAFSSKVDGIKKDIPFLSISPRVKNSNDTGIIFVNGLNGTKTMISYFNFDVFKDKWLFTFDNRGQGENKNFASRFYKQYVNDAYATIQFLINKYNNIKNWFLVGESWGAGIISLILKKDINQKIKGAFFWNMPCKIVNISPRKGMDAFINNLKVFLNYVFLIGFKINNPASPLLTNNQVLFRMMKLYEKQKINTGTIIACWKTLKPAWKNIINNSEKLNFHYVQSKDDVLKDENWYLKLFEKNKTKITIFEKGTHILSFDQNEDYQLFSLLDEYIKKCLKC